jgi:hypothetical protein
MADNDRTKRLDYLLSEYLRITECTDPNGPPLPDAQQRELTNRISGQAITIVETLLCSPMWQEIKDRAKVPNA